VAHRPDVLALTRSVLRGLVVLNALYALAIASLLVATLIAPNLLFRALVGLKGAGSWELHAALRSVVVIGIVGAYVVHRVLRELQAMVDTVRDGDPFVAGNARRLQAIAWWVLAGEGLRLLVGTIAWSVSRYAQPLHIHIDFSLAPWLTVLLLFVLARVFDEGARMRADLEGTV
jgi:hypothetical protein